MACLLGMLFETILLSIAQFCGGLVLFYKFVKIKECPFLMLWSTNLIFVLHVVFRHIYLCMIISSDFLNLFYTEYMHCYHEAYQKFLSMLGLCL